MLHDGNGWVVDHSGRRHWGRFGAAGLLVVDRRGPGEPTVLMQHRAAWTADGGTWGIPGGARDSHEDAVAAALREANEETELPADAVEVTGEPYVDDHGGWSYTTVLATLVADVTLVVEAESEALAWVGLDEVEERPLHPGFAQTWPVLRSRLETVGPAVRWRSPDRAGDGGGGMDEATEVIRAIRSGHDTLVALVESLTEEDLARASAASEWDVSQVLSHLGSGAEITRAGLRAALDGTDPPGVEQNRVVWARWDAMGRRERADGYLRADTELVELLESFDDATRQAVRIEVGFLPPLDLAGAGRLRLNELTLHSWDVRAVFDRGATLPTDAVTQLLRREPDLTAFIAKPDQRGSADAVLRVTTTEPESVFALRLADQVRTSTDVPAQVDGMLDLPGESWLRLVTGRLAADRTPDSVKTTGNADLELLRRVFPGY